MVLKKPFDEDLLIDEISVDIPEEIDEEELTCNTDSPFFDEATCVEDDYEQI